MRKVFAKIRKLLSDFEKESDSLRKQFLGEFKFNKVFFKAYFILAFIFLIYLIFLYNGKLKYYKVNCDADFCENPAYNLCSEEWCKYKVISRGVYSENIPKIISDAPKYLFIGFFIAFISSFIFKKKGD